MKRWLVSVALLMWSVVSATANEPPLEPKGGPPMILTAQVGGKEGDQVTFMKHVFFLIEVEEGGKKSTKQMSKKVAMPAMPIGKDIRAYGVDGKPLDKPELAKRLSKPSPVAVFYTDPPDAYYLQLLREGTVVFVVPREMFESPPSTTPTTPPPPKK